MRHKKLLVLLVVAALALPLAANARMWVGGYLGPNFVGTSEQKLGFTTIKNYYRDISVLGGTTIGYDFVNEGFLGYAYPDWMKYFSFAIDVGYNRFDAPRQSKDWQWPQGTFPNSRFNNVVANAPNGNIEGYNWTFGFLFMGHYGFFPDSEVPQGRLHPYVGIGPALMVTNLNAKGIGFNEVNTTSIALMLESGLRFFALKNVSMDLAFRWRYSQPRTDLTAGWNNPLGVAPGTKAVTNFDANLYNIVFRVAYHF